MCTLSIIRTGPSAVRIVCNRDEHRERTPAAPPRWHERGRLRSIWPTDRHAGGTWLGAGEHGLALGVLNVNPPRPASVLGVPGLRSRGELVPALIWSAGAGEAIDRLGALDLSPYPPFRMVAVELGADGRIRIGEGRWDRRTFGTAWHAEPPLCFVSSGLGDALAAPRLDLFEELVVQPGPTPERQDEFHGHTWATRPEVSVMMSRAEARTMSVTTIELSRSVGAGGAGGARATMDYRPVPDAVRAVARGGGALGRPL